MKSLLKGGEKNSALGGVLETLRCSPFRRGFALAPRDLRYTRGKGLNTIREHAYTFIRARLGPALPLNDGKQTPMKGHPVFVAQHATATCCRRCLQRWHGIERGRTLTEGEIEFIVDLIVAWILNCLTQGPEQPR
ncbi:MAG: DUF4186 domain-containing protein [Deltaproteobacteria bacterium]|nr:DUF4186 domain-containing protein [Deltaproteobacteria bacterium]